VTPSVAIAYAIVAVFLYGLGRYPAVVMSAMPMGDKAMAATPAE
jgi:hypothetical protein